MTKYEMAMEIMKDIKWSEGFKVRKAKLSERNTKARVTELYKAYLKDKEHAVFYASFL